MNIYSGNDAFLFEGFINMDINPILNLLKQNNIIVNDPIGIQSVLNRTTDERECQAYINKNFKEMAREFDLDNPRGIYVLK